MRGGRISFAYADVAQLVEHRLPKPGVVGSSPIVRSSWLSRKPRVTGAFVLLEARRLVPVDTSCYFRPRQWRCGKGGGLGGCSRSRSGGCSCAGCFYGRSRSGAARSTVKLPPPLVGAWARFITAADWARVGITGEPPVRTSMLVSADGSVVAGESADVRFAPLSGSRLVISGAYGWEKRRASIAGAWPPAVSR